MSTVAEDIDLLTRRARRYREREGIVLNARTTTEQWDAFRGERRTKPYTHCAHGHPFTEDNTYVQPSTGKRRCRVCMREADRRSNRKRPNRKR